MSRWTSRCLATSIAVLAAAGVGAGPASARATVETFDVPLSGTDSGLTDECFGFTGGELVGSGRIVGRIVTVGEDAVIQGREDDTGLITWSDGSTSVLASRDQFSLVDHTPDDGVFVNTVAHVDTATVYDADGDLVGTEVFRAVEHVTVVGGEAVVEFDRGRLTCS